MEELVRLTLEGDEVLREEVILEGVGRIRDVRQGPDGMIYLAMDADERASDSVPTPILRLAPNGTR